MDSMHKIVATNPVDMLRCLAVVYRTEQKADGIQTRAQFEADVDDEAASVRYLMIDAEQMPIVLAAVFTVHGIIAKLNTSRAQSLAAEMFLAGTLPQIERFVITLIRAAAVPSFTSEGAPLVPIISDSSFASRLDDMAILLSFLDKEKAPVADIVRNFREPRPVNPLLP